MSMPARSAPYWVALRKESVDRNILVEGISLNIKRSLSARRAWIEISYGALAGASEIVALRKESVDRNHIGNSATALPSVALRKESVDRNLTICNTTNNLGLSLSARRAWIEMCRACDRVCYP